MSIADILSPESVMMDVRPACKREALAQIATQAATLTGQAEADILDVLLEREKLGSTGVGDGVAIPHGKLDGLSRITGIFARFDNAIDFDAVDNLPVDLCFLLLAPANATAAHLKALAKVARLLRDDDVRNALRNADTPELMFALVTTERKSDAA